jgi:hypothetical protein
VQAFIVVGFEQIVKRLHIKGSESKIIVSGYENRTPGSAGPYGFEERKTIHTRHLNVEKDNIDRVVLQAKEGLLSSGALRNQFQTCVQR